MSGENTPFDSLMTLREAGICLIDCDHRTPTAVAEGIPYVTIPQMREGRLILNEARRISAEDYAEWTRKACPMPHDVVLSRRCNPGETASVQEGMQFALGQNLVLLRADGTEVYPPFLRWLVRGPDWWAEVGQYLNVGAVFDSLKCGDIPNFRLPIPPLPEQRRIAHILGTLDDKIEVNRRMCATLEEMARAVFRSWFVDFDPVRAKVAARAEGRDPERAAMAALSGKPESALDTLPPETQASLRQTASLFPDALVDSEVGEIPEGWEVKSLLDYAQVHSGGTPATNRPEYWDGGIAWASAKDVSQCGALFLIATERSISERGLRESPTKLIPAWATVLVARGATTGRSVMFGEAMAMNQTCYALTAPEPVFLYLTFRSLVDQLLSGAHGSVFNTFTVDTLRRANIVLPPEPTRATFDVVAGALMKVVLEKLREARSLAVVRDTLLTPLLSASLAMEAI